MLALAPNEEKTGKDLSDGSIKFGGKNIRPGVTT